MKKSNFRPTHFSVPQNYVDKVQPKGVDLSSPQMEVDKDRGVYSINYMFNGKKACKRFGYRKVGYQPSNEANSIKAVWRMKANGDWLYIFYITRSSTSNVVYTATFKNGRFVDWFSVSASSQGNEVTSNSGFVTYNETLGQLLYLFGANGLEVYRLQMNDTLGKEVLIRDRNFESYVPTTTIAIPPARALVMPTEGSTAYEQANILSPVRKNAFIGGILTDCFHTYLKNYVWASYPLDSKTNYETDGGPTTPLLADYKLKIKISTNGKARYRKLVDNQFTNEADDKEQFLGGGTIIGVPMNIYWFTQELREEGLDILGSGQKACVLVNEADLPENYKAFGHNASFQVKSVTHYATTDKASESSDGYSGLLYIKVEIQGTDYEVLVLGGVFKTWLYLRQNWLPESGEPSESNIVLQYTVATSEQPTILMGNLRKCHHTTFFGHNNSLNRVWLWGENYAFVSAEATQDYEIDDEVHDANGDFTYFPADNFYKFGENDSSIIGMQVLNENKMMVLKGKSFGSPSVYFVSPTVVTAYIGTNAVEEERYSTAPSNTSTAGFDGAYNSIANFNGDIVFLSTEKQIVGLDIEGITGDSRRAAYSRSVFIDKELEAINEPKSTTLFSFGNYLILDIKNDGVVHKTFIANRSQFNSETRQYEWWPIDNIGAECFFESDNNVFFTKGKNIYKLEGHSDIERYFIDTESGNLGLANEEYFVTTASILEVVANEEGWKWEFKYDSDTVTTFAKIGECSAILHYEGMSGNYPIYSLNEEYIHLSKYLVDGAKVRVNGNVCEVTDTDNDSVNGRVFTFNTADIVGAIEIPLEGKYGIVAVEGVEGAFKLDNPDFISYAHTDTSIAGEFSKETPIVSSWVSRPVPISKFTYDKTIKQVDVYNDTTEPAELYIGCITNKQLHTYQYAKIEEFDLSDIDWENTTFDKNRVPIIYHMRRFPRKQQYFSLVQMSDSLDNSLLSDMDITYTLNGVARNKK